MARPERPTPVVTGWLPTAQTSLAETAVTALRIPAVVNDVGTSVHDVPL